MDSWAKKRGTLLAFTTFYTPEQNALERGMRIIANAMQSMLVDSGLPQEFWEEAAATSIYLANKSFNPKVSMTPYKALYGRRPNVNHLHIFGSLAYVHIPKESANWHKILPRAFKGILTRYGGSSYRIFNPQTRRFAITNHCTIYKGVKGALLLPSPNGSPAPSLPSLPLLEDISNQHKQNTIPTLTENDFDNNEVLYGNTIIIAHPRDSPNLELGGDYSDINSQPGGESPNRASQKSSSLPDNIPDLPIQQNDSISINSSRPASLSPKASKDDFKDAQEAPPATSSAPTTRIFQGREVSLVPTKRSDQLRDQGNAKKASSGILSIKPSTIKEALSSTDSIKWKDAIKSEINSLIKNHT
jgi:hypothetical protein